MGPTPKSSAQTAASAKSSTTQMGQLRKPTTAQTDNWPQQRPVTSMGRSRRTKLTVPTPKSSAQTAASAKSSTTQMGQLRKPTTAQTDNWPQQRPVTSMGRSRRTKLTVPTPKSSAQTAASAKSSTTQMGQLPRPTTAQTRQLAATATVTSMGRSRRTKLTVPTPKSSAQTAASVKSSTTQMGQLPRPTTAQTDNWPRQRP